MKLRTYQKRAVKRIKELLSAGARPICYAPTGAGKTVIAGEVFSRVDRGLRVFVVHTDQLRQQAAEYLRPLGVLVTTIQSMLLRPDLYRDAVLVGFDECHHLQGQAWREAVSIFKPECSMFGLSATPFACTLDEIFTCRLTIARVEDLVADGYILPVSIVHPSEAAAEALGHNDRIDGALAYAKLHRGKQAIHFEPTVELCSRALEQYKALGIAASVIHGKTNRTQRDIEIDRFRNKQMPVLISPVLLSEGFDAPCAEVLVAGRAFASDVLLQQGVGRIRRMYPGKTQAFLIDCTGCCAGRTAEYFNRTDETLFSSLPDAEDDGGEGKGRSGVLGPVKRPAAFNWVDIDEWVTESADGLANEFSRRQRDELVEMARQVAAIETAVDETRRERARERERKRYADPAVREAKLEAQREYQRSRSADPAYHEARREAQRKVDRKRSSDPAQREAQREYMRKRGADPAYREAKREYMRKRGADPAYREAKREYARKYRAAKKAAAAV